MTDTFIVTRCPACATAFRANAGQLSARDGQVRCGRCNAVFDALGHALQPGPASSETDEKKQPQESADTRASQASDGRAASAGAVHPSLRAEELVLTPAPMGALPHEIEVQPPPQERYEVADPNLEFDFGRPKARVRPGSGLLLMPLIGLLLATLSLQVAYHFRGDIALLFPATKLTLQGVCARLGCSLPLPQRADMMSIESSDLQADVLNPGVMVLSATLRNRAPFAQSPPALELTLTDAQDQPLARRVLTVADYLRTSNAASTSPPQEALTAFASGSELPVKVYFDASAVQPTGYRLYLFYP